MNCPKCDADIGDTYESADPSVGIMSGGYYCGACDLAVGEDDYEPLDDDVLVAPEPRDPAKPLGTPISEISGQPGKPGYAEFARIARSWGYD